MAKVTTVIDIGSNSARMAIFKKTSRYGFHLIHELKSKVRISEGSYEHNSYLQPQAMKRALIALKNFKQVSQSFKSRKLICIATSAIRDAPNNMEFIREVKKECSIDIKIINGTKEAFFGAIACANLIHKASGITIDIGGGSTELACINNRNIKDMVSLNLGSIRLKELFFDHNKIEEAYRYTKKYVRTGSKSIIDFCHKSGLSNKLNVFGIGGSIRAYAKYKMSKLSYPLNFLHGYELNAKDIIQDINKIVHANAQELLDMGIENSRIDSIRPGLLILQVILEELQAHKLIISGVGVREGVFLNDMLRNQNGILPVGFNPSVRSLQDIFLINVNDSRSIYNHAKNLFILLQKHLSQRLDLKFEYLYYLKVASELYNIGANFNFYQAHKHSSYIALNCLNYGFSHQQRYTIATLLETSHKKRPKQISQSYINLLPSDYVLQVLSFTLAIGVTLAKQKEAIFNIQTDSMDSTLIIKLYIESCSLPTQQALLDIMPPRLESYDIKMEILIN